MWLTELAKRPRTVTGLQATEAVEGRRGPACGPSRAQHLWGKRQKHWSSRQDGKTGTIPSGRIGLGLKEEWGRRWSGCIHHSHGTHRRHKRDKARKSVPPTLSPSEGAGGLDRTELPPARKQGGFQRGAFLHPPSHEGPLGETGVEGGVHHLSDSTAAIEWVLTDRTRPGIN